MRISKLAFFAGFVILAPVSESVSQWRVAPSIGVGFLTNDNATLSPVRDLESSISGIAGDLGVEITYESPLTSFALTPSVTRESYDDSDFDATNSFLNLRWNRTGQRFQFGLRGDVRDQVIRDGEFTDVDFDVDEPGEIPVDDSGLTFSNNNRLRVLLEPQWRYQLGQRTTVALSYRYTDTTFDDNNQIEFNDFSEGILTGQLGYDLTERDNLAIEAYSRNSDFDNGRDISGAGVGLGYRRQLSETSRIEVLLGVDSTEADIGNDQNNGVGSFSFVRDFETGRLLASYRRVVAASGGGIVSVRDQFDLNGVRELSERTSVSLGLRAYSTDALEDQNDSFDARDSLQFRARLQWRATRAFLIELDYRYNTLDRDSFESEADANRFSVWFRYKPEVR